MEKTYFKILISILFISCFSVFSLQAQNWVWAERAGATGLFNQGYSISSDASGNTYVTGTFIDTITLGTFTLIGSGNQSEADIFVAKYNSSGTCLWAKSAGGASWDEGYSITSDNAGNAYVTGTFDGSASFGTFTLTSGTVFIAKYNTSGVFQWATSNDSNKPNSIISDGSTNLYVIGNFSGTATFGTYTLIAQSNQELYIARYNTAGICLWAKKTGGSGYNPASISVDPSNNLYITGSYNGTATFGTFSLPTSVNDDVFIAKYNSSGICLWAYSAGGSNQDNGKSVSTDLSGNIYLVGIFTGTSTFGAFTVNSTGDNDLYIAKYDSSGTCQWVKNAGGNSNDNVSVTTDNDGYVYIAGDFSGSTATFGNNITLTSSSSSGNSFIALYDNLGTCMYAGTPAGTSEEYINSISTDTFGNVYMTGFYTSGSLIFGNTTLSHPGTSNDDIFLAKLFVKSPPTITNQLVNTTKCSGDMVTFTVSATGIPNLQYQWTKDGNNITNAKSVSLTLTNLALSDTGSYYCIVTNPFGSVNSDSAILTINEVSAAFSVNNSSQCVTGNSFVFTDISSTNIGTITSLSWDLGDSTSFTSDTVNHAYSADSNYTVKLLATSSYGCTDIEMQTINVWPMPNADFTVNDTSQCFSGNSFEFTDISNISSGSITHFWDMGDSITYTNTSPIHPYITVNTFNVKLVTTSNNGCEDSALMDVYVRPMPVADFTMNDSFQCSGNSFIFQDNSTITSGTLSYDWDFGDSQGSSSDSIDHTYNKNIIDTFHVKLTVTSDYGCQDSKIKDVYTISTPSSEFDVDTVTVQTDSMLTITYKGLADTSATYNWSFGGGTVYSGDKQGPYEVYWETNGPKTISLTVIESGCTSSETKEIISVFKTSISITASKTAFCEGESIVLYVTTNTNYSYQWKMNDSIIIPGATLPYYYVTQSGDYNVEVTDNSNGSWAETSPMSIIAHSTDFDLAFTADPKAFIGTPFTTLIDNQTPDEASYNFTWYFGDGSISLLPAPGHTYLYNGTYSIKVIAQHKTTGCIDSFSEVDYIICNGGSANPCNYSATITPKGTEVICDGDSFLLQSNTDISFSYNWIHEGIQIPDATDPVFYAKKSGEYRVMISKDGCSSMMSSPFYVSHYATVKPVIESEGIIKPCSDDSMELYITTYYQDYKWSDDQAGKNIWIHNSGHYTITVTDIHNCSITSDPLTINKALQVIPEICIVTVDTPTNYNYIVWERPISASIESYLIYKETTQANVYKMIGTKGYKELSVLIDSNSFPSKSADRYRISLIDTCGYESAMSPPHKTMHVTASTGTSGENNLIWSHYEGFSFPTYYIYRGSSPDSIYILDSIQSNLNSFTDEFPPAGDVVFYRVTIAKPDICYPLNVRGITSTGPYSQSLSNLQDYSALAAPYLSIFPIITTLTSDSGSSVDFHVYSNLSTWDAVSNESWLTVELDIINGIITATTNKNMSNNIRNAIITISGTDVGGQAVTVLQLGTTGITGIQPWNHLTIYPNPFNNTTNIYLPDGEDFISSLEIIDLQGRVKKAMYNIHGDKISINAADFEKGMYIVKLVGKQIYVDKIIVE